MNVDSQDKPTRRDLLKYAAAGAAGAVLPNWGFGEPSRPQRPYNIIFIMGDDFANGEIGCYGSTTCRTPNVDALAENGARFETCWATPLCNPSRVELMTGRYGFRTRFYHNWMTPPERVTDKNTVYPELLKKVGYTTAMAGKWHHVGPPWDYGFDESCVVWGAGKDWARGEMPDTQPGYRTWQPLVVKNGESIPTGPDDFSGDICADFLIDFITRNKERPFYAYFPTILGHSNFYPTPDSLQAGEDRFRFETSENFNAFPAPDSSNPYRDEPSAKPPKNFWANVEYVDKLVGRIVEAVDGLGLRDRTIIIFTTDNGTPAAKAHALEDGCQVPLIVNCPSALKVGGARRELVDFSDMFPTFIDLAGGKLPRDNAIDGRSFAPLLLGEPYKPRDWVFSYCGEERMLRDGRWLSMAGGRFFDCGDNRDGNGYIEVTDSTDSEVAAARKRFDKILAQLPQPAEDDPLFAAYREEERKFLQQDPYYSLNWYPEMRYPPKETPEPFKR